MLTRWINMDPALFSSGANRFIYIGNQPTNFIDPGGNFWHRCRNGTVIPGVYTITCPDGTTFKCPGVHLCRNGVWHGVIHCSDPCKNHRRDQCEYYSEQCGSLRFDNVCQVLYYCVAANFVCRIVVGNSDWENCVKKCLQDFDGLRDQLREDERVPIIGTIIGCAEHVPLEVLDHVFCFAYCAT